MSIEHLPTSATAEQVGAALARDGVVVVDRLVGTDVIERAADELAPYLAATRFGTDDFSGKRTRRTGGLVARSATCRELVMHPLVLGAVGNLLEHLSSFQLHLTQVIAIDPGEPAQ